MRNKSTRSVTGSINYHANVLPLPRVEHLAVFHRHVQLPRLRLLKWDIELEPVVRERGFAARKARFSLDLRAVNKQYLLYMRSAIEKDELTCH